MAWGWSSGLLFWLGPLFSNKQSTTLFKMEGYAGEGPDHAFPIPSPRECQQLPQGA